MAATTVSVSVSRRNTSVSERKRSLEVEDSNYGPACKKLHLSTADWKPVPQADKAKSVQDGTFYSNECNLLESTPRNTNNSGVDLNLAGLFKNLGLEELPVLSCDAFASSSKDATDLHELFEDLQELSEDLQKLSENLKPIAKFLPRHWSEDLSNPEPAAEEELKQPEEVTQLVSEEEETLGSEDEMDLENETEQETQQAIMEVVETESELSDIDFGYESPEPNMKIDKRSLLAAPKKKLMRNRLPRNFTPAKLNLDDIEAEHTTRRRGSPIRTSWILDDAPRTNIIPTANKPARKKAARKLPEQTFRRVPKAPIF